jgi:hypothetical protein
MKNIDKAVKLIPMILPVAGSFVFVLHNSHYFSNVPFLDEWNQVSLWYRQYNRTLTFSQLWQQHNQNRMLIPNLIYLAMVNYFKRPDIALQYFTNALMIIANIILSWHIGFKNNQGSTKEVIIRTTTTAALSTIILSLVEYENLLWSFQDAWTLIYVAQLSVALIQEKYRTTSMRNYTFVIQVLICTAASFSSIQGLLTWLIPLYYYLKPDEYSHKNLRIRKIYLAATVSSAALVFLIYFRHFDLANGMNYSPGNNGIYSAFRYFIELFAAPLQLGIGTTMSIALGILLLLMTILMALLGMHKKEFLLPGSLSVVTLAFATMTSIGRYHLGIISAASSRYSLYMLIPLISLTLTIAIFSIESVRILNVKSLPITLTTLISLFIAVAMIKIDTQMQVNFVSTLQSRSTLVTEIKYFPHLADSVIQSNIYPSAPYVKPLIAFIKAR